ncbi:MAG TPA: putative toxin [Aggregatilineaceae bacterium]|nr:putative toxin [Aggregatilineaceae bacterium]
MIQRLRRLLIVLAFIGILICIVLLSNYTPRNPAHRRYSSDTPRTSGNPTTVGASAEVILANDLDLPRNDQSGQLMCICKTGGLKDTAGRCKSCLVQLPNVDTFRIPDFVSDDMLIEAKNVKILESSDYTQLEDYAEAAKALDLKLWIYVRVDTDVSPQYHRLAESTGGKVVHYFTYAGYHDPLNIAGMIGLVASILIGGFSMLFEVAARRQGRLPQPRKNHPGAAVQDLEDFTMRIRSRAEAKIDRDGQK